LSEPGLDHEILPDSEAERARTALDRHMKGRPLPDDFKALQRIGAFLMRRGFDPDTVRATLRAAGRDDSGRSGES
jgi:SOS response regulatory protein OraA/RecX